MFLLFRLVCPHLFLIIHLPFLPLTQNLPSFMLPNLVSGFSLLCSPSMAILFLFCLSDFPHLPLPPFLVLELPVYVPGWFSPPQSFFIFLSHGTSSDHLTFSCYPPPHHGGAPLIRFLPLVPTPHSFPPL